MTRRLPALLLAVALAAIVTGAAVAASPTAITGTVSAIDGTSATLGGTVNPAGVATDWWFEYGPTTSYGSKTATTAAGSGSANVAVSKGLTGLTPSTTYHYRLVAKNVSGTTNGSDGLFTTASPPTVVTGAASGVGPTVATLGGTVNPNGQATTWYVEFGTTTSYGTKTSSADAGSGTSAKSVSTGVSGLTVGRTYHFRVVATNSGGTTNGADAAFVTADAPVATTSAASSIGSTSAKLNGKVDPNSRSTTYFFEVGTTTSYGSRTPNASAGSGSNPTGVSATISGLKAGTTYNFRLVASSDAGTSIGSNFTFTTQGAPTVVTGAASGLGSSTATVAGTVGPNGRSTSWYVEYGTTTSYGSKTSSRSAGSGTDLLNVTASLSSLKPGVTYHFRLVAGNAIGTTNGADATFSTVGPPLAATGPVDVASLSLVSARVSGKVNPRGLPTTWWFEYGRTNAYGFRTSEASVAGAEDVQVSTLLAGLTPGSRWHYRFVARSAAGTTAGADASFATPPRPVDPSGRPVACTIVGTQAADVLRGTAGRDVICGLGGNDRILGGGRADIVYGGPGADFIDGGTGNDILRGGAGNDDLIGRSGNDRLEGGLGADRLDGGTGSDALLGGAGKDLMLARDGRRDLVNGGSGVDRATVDRNVDRLIAIEQRRFA